MAERVLDMENLHVSFDTYAGEVKAVRGVTLHVDEGEVLAIVGESGCGKSVTAQTIMKLNPMPPARIVEGKINLAGHDIVKASEKDMQKIRGQEVAATARSTLSSTRWDKRASRVIPSFPIPSMPSRWARILKPSPISNCACRAAVASSAWVRNTTSTLLPSRAF